MNTPDHPLTETAAIEDRLRDSWVALLDLAIAPGMTYEHGTRAREIARDLNETICAIYSAGREHERAQARPTEITDEMRRAAASAYEDMAQVTRPENHEKCLNAALEAALAVATPADPHADPRPWQDCTRDDIRAGDLVAARVGDTLRIGVAYHQDEYGDWETQDSYMLTDGDDWPLRRIPATAPTPPAEEITLPTEHPAHITDVEDADGDVCAYMARSKSGVWVGVDQDGDIRDWVPGAITAFTLPDGTRALYEGIRADGSPRFVKEDA